MTIFQFTISKQSNLFYTKNLSGGHLCMVAGHNPLMVMPSPFCTWIICKLLCILNNQHFSLNANKIGYSDQVQYSSMLGSIANGSIRVLYSIFQLGFIWINWFLVKIREQKTKASPQLHHCAAGGVHGLATAGIVTHLTTPPLRP